MNLRTIDRAEHVNVNRENMRTGARADGCS